MAQKMAKYFIMTAIFFFLVGCIEGMMFPTKFHFQSFYATFLHIPPDHLKAFFSNFVTKIHTHINLIGWVSSSLMGILYFLVPQIQGKERYRVWACYANFWAHILGILLFCIGFHLIGLFGLESGFTPGSPEFRKVVAPFKIFVLAGGAFIFLSALLFSYNMVRTLYGKD